MVIDQCELESLPLESTAFGRIVGDDTVGEKFDKTIHPAKDKVDLVDIFHLLNARGCQILHEDLTKAFISDRGQSGKSIRSSIFCPRDVGDAEPREQGL